MTIEQFFVEVNNPKDIRKSLLQSSKQLVESLVSCEKYKSLRSKKIALLGDLKTTMDGIIFLNKKLRHALPHLPQAPKPAAMSSVLVAPAPKDSTSKKLQKKQVQKPTPKKKSRLDELREELENFEKKLASLE